jgi:hypothetical protein
LACALLTANTEADPPSLKPHHCLLGALRLPELLAPLRKRAGLQRAHAALHAHNDSACGRELAPAQQARLLHVTYDTCLAQMTHRSDPLHALEQGGPALQHAIVALRQPDACGKLARQERDQPHARAPPPLRNELRRLALIRIREERGAEGGKVEQHGAVVVGPRRDVARAEHVGHATDQAHGPRQHIKVALNSNPAPTPHVTGQPA